jgi:mRNA interferase HigB
MKARLIRKESIESYVLQNAASRASFRIWLMMIKQVDWIEPGDIAQTFGSSDLLGNGTSRVVFNIAGNKYRIICKYHFGIQVVHLFIKWIGTHAEYTSLCNKQGQYFVDAYKLK